MTAADSSRSERVLVMAPYGRDAAVAAEILREGGVETLICADIAAVAKGCQEGAGVALIVEEVLQEVDYGPLARCIEAQPPWSDFPVVVLSMRGPGLERNPAWARYTQVLGNVSFLERPFHPTTLVSVIQTALRGRRRQYEAKDRLEALRNAVARQQADQERLRLMVNELNHRVKNTLATVQSIVAQTLRGHDAAPEVSDTLTARVMALSRAHDVLTDEQWSGADLREIAGQAASPYQRNADDRFVIDGPTVRLPPKTAIAVALAFHELATNAAKYGALSVAAGQVDLTWTLRPAEGKTRLRIIWRESGGPPVEPPRRAGFGTRLIEKGLAADLGGQVVLTYPPEGVECVIDAELPVEPPSARQHGVRTRRARPRAVTIAAAPGA